MGNITMKLDICFDICETTCIISKILCSLTHEGLRPGGYTNPYGASGINMPNQTCGATCCGEPCEYVPRTWEALVSTGKSAVRYLNTLPRAPLLGVHIHRNMLPDISPKTFIKGFSAEVSHVMSCTQGMRQRISSSLHFLFHYSSEGSWMEFVDKSITSKQNMTSARRQQLNQA